jgi:hypothetical protein
VDWLLNLSTPAMTLVVLVIVYLVTAIVYLVITRLATGERIRVFKAVSPGMLPPMAVVFALLIAFLASQVWSDSDRASAAVNREASALRATVLLADQFPGQADTQMRVLIRQHIQMAVRHEWPAMARRGVTLSIVPGALAQALKLTLSLDPKTPGQNIAQREMVTALQTALDARRQRIVLSGSAVNAVKWAAVLAQAGLMLIAIALVHCDTPTTNRIILGLFATGVAAAIVLVAANSRPFSGAISVQPTLLLQVMPEADTEP